MEVVLAHDHLPELPVTEHYHFSGASLAVTAQTYRECGGLPVCAALAWLPRDVRPVVCERDRNVSIPSALRLQPLALKIANRPPPASVRLA